MLSRRLKQYYEPLRLPLTAAALSFPYTHQLVASPPPMKKPEPPPTQMIRDGEKPKHLSDIPEEMWNENYKPELPPSFIEKYFNSESLHHALVFGSIVFGLKMIELNWSFILGYINSIPIEAMYLSVMFFILTQTIIRAPKTNHTGFK